MNNENNNKPDTLFIDGFYSEDVPETAPEWILGKGSIGIDKMIKFLNENRHIAVNGAIKYTIKMAKSGKRYVEVDHFGLAKYRDYLAKKTVAVPETTPEMIYQNGVPDFGDIQ
jgi:hypothetical protein